MNTKSAVRARLRAERLKLSPEEVSGKSAQIVANLRLLLRAQTFSTIHCYEPLVTLNEVDVSPLFSTVEATFYTSRKIDAAWQIVSVNDGQIRQPPDLDLIIVPMLGFDQSGHRIGYGGGYYDRLLAAYPDAQTIGVCYEQGRLAQLPVESHDIALDLIVTEVNTAITP